MTIDVNTCRAQDKQSQLLLVYCSQTAGAQPLTTLAFCSYQPDDGVPRMQKVRSLLLGGIQICQELHSFKIKKNTQRLKKNAFAQRDHRNNFQIFGTDSLDQAMDRNSQGTTQREWLVSYLISVFSPVSH